MVTVSIITPLYNCSEFLEKTIESVISQSFKDWELIMVDDCSVDGSLLIAQKFSQIDGRIKLLTLSNNSGAAVARNAGIEFARGRYIAFLDGDDVWLPNKLDEQVKFMQFNNVVFSYSAYEKVDKSGEGLGIVGVPDRVSYTDLLKVCSIGCLTAIYDSEILGKIYMPIIRKRQDLGLWLRILKVVPYAYATPGLLAQYRVHGGSISANKWSAAQYTWRLYHEVEGLNFLKAVYYFFHYAINGVLRTKLPRIAKFLGALK